MVSNHPDLLEQFKTLRRELYLALQQRFDSTQESGTAGTRKAQENGKHTDVHKQPKQYEKEPFNPLTSTHAQRDETVEYREFSEYYPDFG